MGAFFIGQTLTDTEYQFSDWEKDEDGNLDTGGQASYTVTSSSDIYYQVTAANVAVCAQSLADSAYFSTATDVVNGTANYDLGEELLKLESGVEMFRGNNASSFLETLLSDITVDTERATIFQTTYSNLETSISNQRTSISGVDEDEEALNLVKYQNAYNMASKIISVMSEMYDKLINETGV
jgi:flagellar hook-associated protein 1 FlgK